MRFDLRVPIGLLFATIGVVLAVYGLRSDPEIYRAHSLGLNVNLIWGSAMAVFGLAMLGLALISRRKS